MEGLSKVLGVRFFYFPPNFMTKVVNIYKETSDVYIGRAGKGKDGYFGNPFRVGATCQACGEYHADGESTLACFKMYFEYRLEHDAEYRQRVMDLRGKILGCFCKPRDCHGDVMAKYLESDSE